ncbi:MAG: hypothetical protein HYY37_00830 [Candidatus Aenigmarchaeota archaeon]|nr:hypothetical protein [Candidatus Aenigmarchaeota archaeon]
MDQKLIAVAIISALLGVVAFMGYQLYGTAKTTGYAAQQGQYQGFSSYEEMMQAHHGGSSSGSCGMESGAAPSRFATGEMTAYGITLDNAGYEKLLTMNSIRLDAGQQQKIVGLDIELPCCGFQKIEAAGNCECGHHVAMVGLAKLLATKNYSREQIQQELDVWKNIFYPDGLDSGAGACG